MHRARLTKLIRQPAIIYVCIFSLCTLLLGIVILLLLLMRPVADDYAYFSDSLIRNPFRFAVHYYFDWTGRFMQAFWMSSLYRIFGNSVVTLGGIVQLLLLIGSAIFFSYSTLYKKVRDHAWVIAAGLLLSVFTLFMSPSLVDSALWITSSSVYLGSFIAMLSSLAIGFLLVNGHIRGKTYVVIFGVGTFLAQLFSEPSSLIMICFGILGVMITLFLYKNKQAMVLSVVYMLASITGFLFMYFSPGTRTRQSELEIKPGVLDVIFGAFSDLSKMSYIFTSYRIVLIVIAGVLLSMVFAKIKDKKVLVGPLVITLIVALSTPLLLFLSTRYTLGSYAPMRAFTAPAAIMGVSLAIALGIGIAILPKKIRGHYSSLTMLLLFIFSIFSTLSYLLPVTKAVAIRSSIYDSREESIKQQLSLKSSAVHFEPLPLLIEKTEAVDFYYNDDAPRWFEDGFRKYYSIPRSTQIIYEKQPAGYCVIEGTPGWLGAKDCHVMQRDPKAN